MTTASRAKCCIENGVVPSCGSQEATSEEKTTSRAPTRCIRSICLWNISLAPLRNSVSSPQLNYFLFSAFPAKFLYSLFFIKPCTSIFHLQRTSLQRSFRRKAHREIAYLERRRSIVGRYRRYKRCWVISRRIATTGNPRARRITYCVRIADAESGPPQFAVRSQKILEIKRLLARRLPHPS